MSSEEAPIAAHQAAMIDRVVALLERRAAARKGGAVEEMERRIVARTEELERIERDHRVPFAEACRAMHVSGKRRDALVAIAAPHLDDSFRDVITRFWGRATRNFVDAALLLDLLTEDRAEAIAAAPVFVEDGPFHRAGLVESVAVSVGHQPSPLEHELVPTPRLLRLLAGQLGLDPRLRRFTTVLTTQRAPSIGVVTAERFDELASLVRACRKTTAARRGADLMLAGAPGAGKLRLALGIGHELGHRVAVVVESAFLPSDPQRLTRIFEALALEASMLGGVLVLRHIEHLIDGAKVASVVRHALASVEVPVWLTTDADPRRDDRPHLLDLATLAASVPPPDTALRTAAWTADLVAVGVQVPDETIKVLAGEYPLPRAAIEVCVAVTAATGARDQAAVDLLPRIAESQMRGELARFARRSRNRARLEHLVLGPGPREQVIEVLEAVRRRTLVMERWGLTDRHATGRGIVAMFNGPPGTGKTLSANVIANELELPLYRIDVSNLVDRYVGETEKNLSRLFDEAAACRAALLFDEADSLFGKRVDAKDATDRFANMQVNLLLNLIEEYDGFVVLTTNLKGAVDTAFLRRIAYKVTFDMPEHDERLALWAYHLPPSIPRDADVDLEELADEFDTIAGGDIRNAVLRAALAAGGERPVSQDLLRQSMINELRANGSVVADRR